MVVCDCCNPPETIMLHSKTRGIYLPNNLAIVIGKGNLGEPTINPTTLTKFGMTFHSFEHLEGGRWLAPDDKIIPPAQIYCLVNKAFIDSQLLTITKLACRQFGSFT